MRCVQTQVRVLTQNKMDCWMVWKKGLPSKSILRQAACIFLLSIKAELKKIYLFFWSSGRSALTSSQRCNHSISSWVQYIRPTSPRPVLGCGTCQVRQVRIVFGVVEVPAVAVQGGQLVGQAGHFLITWTFGFTQKLKLIVTISQKLNFSIQIANFICIHCYGIMLSFNYR